MAAPVEHELQGSARMVDRALRAVGDTTHALRQRLLARKLGRTLAADQWQPTPSEEPGLTADDLRRRAASRPQPG